MPQSAHYATDRTMTRDPSPFGLLALLLLAGMCAAGQFAKVSVIFPAVQAAYPQAGDKLVCLRNDPAKGLLNGSLWKVMTASRETVKPGINLLVRPEDEQAWYDRLLAFLAKHNPSARNPAPAPETESGAEAELASAP